MTRFMCRKPENLFFSDEANNRCFVYWTLKNALKSPSGREMKWGEKAFSKQEADESNEKFNMKVFFGNQHAQKFNTSWGSLKAQWRSINLWF